MLYFWLATVLILQVAALIKLYSKPAHLKRIADLQVMSALHTAFNKSGLNPDHLQNEEFDVVHTGKLGEVIYHLATEMGKPIRTVRQLHDFLEGLNK